jgi:hypothetical protein
MDRYPYAKSAVEILLRTPLVSPRDDDPVADAKASRARFLRAGWRDLLGKAKLAPCFGRMLLE